MGSKSAPKNVTCFFQQINDTRMITIFMYYVNKRLKKGFEVP